MKTEETYEQAYERAFGPKVKICKCGSKSPDDGSVIVCVQCGRSLKNPVCGTDAKERKATPIYSGFLVYFPDAIAAVARLSFQGNEKHNPGTPLHWDRSKSGDEKDALMRHVLDGDWEEVAWRAMANLQKVIEERRG